MEPKAEEKNNGKVREELEFMSKEIIEKSVSNLHENIDAHPDEGPIPFKKFLELLALEPQAIIRSVFQVFHDMVNHYVGEGFNEYPDDPESIGFVYYDCYRLFIENTDRPFFADRLFANRLVSLARSLRKGAQQNKVYIFQGPPGCGKSTFLNNLLLKYETYANTKEGQRYETVWRLSREKLGANESETIPMIETFTQEYEAEKSSQKTNIGRPAFIHETDEYVEIHCPCHDNPILMIPKSYRREFLDNLFKNDKFKYKLFTEKEYEWVFKEKPCTICSALYKAIQPMLDHPSMVFDMIYARKYHFDRRLGEGISVFNPGDKPLRQNILCNDILQHRLDALLKDSNRVRYIFSNYARTNNGIYALMDIKGHNTDRLIELHNIISEGVHKVEHIEENVNSMFVALMNPEDKRNVSNIQSFMDRIEYIKIPYILDIRTEVEIYKNVFGKHIEANFLPKVLHNFARVIVASRLNPRSEALFDWIKDPKKYELYCDRNLLLLKMEIYTGHIPGWLKEDDIREFTAKKRKKIIGESEREGEKGFSGRDSIKIFNEFYSTYAGPDKVINMSNLMTFFEKKKKEHPGLIPDGFLESLCKMYDYNILQEVKESLYYYNEEKISSDILDYLYAINFETGAEIRCIYTNRRFVVNEDFYKSIEDYLLGIDANDNFRETFRYETQKEYTTNTLTQEIITDGRDIRKTDLYFNLHERYLYNLKQKVLDPFLTNDNFRRAIKDYDKKAFKTFDRRIQEDVTFLINNLIKKYRYNSKSAKQVCMYVVDNDLAQKFSNT